LCDHFPCAPPGEKKRTGHDRVDDKDHEDRDESVRPQEEEREDDETRRRERKTEVKPRAQVEQERPLYGHLKPQYTTARRSCVAILPSCGCSLRCAPARQGPGPRAAAACTSRTCPSGPSSGRTSPSRDCP